MFRLLLIVLLLLLISLVFTVFLSLVFTWPRFPVDPCVLSEVEGLARSAVDTPADLSLVAGVCEVPGLVAALSLAAADWLPPLIDLSEVAGAVVEADRF